MKKRIVVPVLVVIAIGLAAGLFYFFPESGHYLARRRYRAWRKQPGAG